MSEFVEFEMPLGMGPFLPFTCPACEEDKMKLNTRDFWECGTCHRQAASMDSFYRHRDAKKVKVEYGLIVWLFPEHDLGSGNIKHDPESYVVPAMRIGHLFECTKAMLHRKESLELLRQIEDLARLSQEHEFVCYAKATRAAHSVMYGECSIDEAALLAQEAKAYGVENGVSDQVIAQVEKAIQFIG